MYHGDSSSFNLMEYTFFQKEMKTIASKVSLGESDSSFYKSDLETFNLKKISLNQLCCIKMCLMIGTVFQVSDGRLVVIYFNF